MFMPEPYKQGEEGIDSCPEGYQAITDPSECEIASKNLGLEYRGDQNTDHADALCNLCAGCTEAAGGASTRLDESHGSKARWICKSLGKYIPLLKSTFVFMSYCHELR